MRFRSLALLGSVIALSHARMEAADRTLPSADEIVEHNVRARGGLEKLRGLRAIIYRGVYREGKDEMPGAAMAMMRPYFKLVGDPEHLNPAFAEGYDGSAWEYYGDPGIVVRTVGAAAAAARHGLWIDGPLTDYREKGSSLTVLGIEPIAGRPAYRLRLRMRDGFEEEEFVDTQNWMVVASRRVAPVHAFGETVRSETRFEDFRPVEGIVFSFRSSEVEMSSARVLNTMTWTSIVVNPVIDPSVFSPPSIRRTVLQTMLDHLYQERQDPQAVLWSYRDFRAAHPGVDTDAGIGAIGYQILKMGDTASAVALLEAGAADYPNSSRAAFGLGRAYATSGNTASARAELKRALALDPTNARAASALARLPN